MCIMIIIKIFDCFNPYNLPSIAQSFHTNPCDQILGNNLNCTSVKIKLTPPVDNYTTILCRPETTQGWF